MTTLYWDDRGRIYIDGHPIDRILNVTVSHDQPALRPSVTIEFFPDSVVYGPPPEYLIEEVLEAHTPVGGGKIDMERAMEKARHPRHRAQSMDVKAVLGPEPTKKAQPMKKAVEVEPSEAMPMSDDICWEPMGGAFSCKRPYGHPGEHSHHKKGV